MSVKVTGRYKQFRCKIRTVFPLDWGSISTPESRWMDFKPFSLDEKTTRRMDFGFISPNTQNSTTE